MTNHKDTTKSVDCKKSTDTTKSTEHTESSNPSSNSSKPTDSPNSSPYTPNPALEGIDYANVSYPPDTELLKQQIQAINATIGCKLKKIRLSARLTQQELGVIIAASAERIERYESGEEGISIGELVMICDDLGADVWYFLL